MKFTFFVAVVIIYSPSDQASWNDGNWLFPRGMRLLEVPEYRKQVLSGIVISVASKTDSTVRVLFIIYLLSSFS